MTFSLEGLTLFKRTLLSNQLTTATLNDINAGRSNLVSKFYIYIFYLFLQVTSKYVRMKLNTKELIQSNANAILSVIYTVMM